MSKIVTIESINFSKAFFRPGDAAQWTITLKSEKSVKLNLITTIIYLDQTLDENHQKVDLDPGIMTLESSWSPPNKSRYGYGLDLRLETLEGKLVDSYSSAFDVLEYWTQNPRYGFLTDFSPNRHDIDQVFDNLMKYHINGLQFYDWMYRHDQYLTVEEPYYDPLGRLSSRATVDQLITSAHAHGMAAMPYTAVYAASIPFFEQHKDWALYKMDGTPFYFGENFLVLMDPRSDSPWTKHLLNQFDTVLAETEFDGIHLDQYGDQGYVHDAAGHSFTLDQPLADLINATKAVAQTRRGDNGAVIFNAVTNWPIETVAPSKEDLVYIEVWPPFTTYNDLLALVIQGQMLGGEKPVVIAAYIDPAYEVNARLIDAILFASGAGHIELGEQGGYLSEAYFPNYKTPTAELSRVLQRYYDFAIRYENVIGPQTHSANKQYANQINMNSLNVSVSADHNKIMPVVRESDHHLAINLINMLGLNSGEWAKKTSQFPTTLDEPEVRITGITKQIKGIWFASPDKVELALIPLDFSQKEDSISLKIPFLQYWDLILIEWVE
jgi:dextranase